jgi:hypothetical protein
MNQLAKFDVGAHVLSELDVQPHVFAKETERDF